MSIMRKLIRSHRKLFSVSITLSIISVTFTLFWNYLLANIFNSFQFAVTQKEEWMNDTILRLILIISIVFLLHILFEYIANYLAGYTCELFGHEIRMGYARYYLESDIQDLEKRKIGEEQSAMQNEMHEISLYLKENFFSLLKQFITFLITTVYLFSQSAILALTLIIPVLPLIVYCAISSKVIKNHTDSCQQSKQEINGLAVVLLELFPIIQVYDSFRVMKNAMYESLENWKRQNIRKERISARLMSLSGVLAFVPLWCLMGIGGYMVLDEKISIGLFYIFINLSGNVSTFLQNMPGIYAGFRKFGASMDRLGERLILREDEYGKICN